MHSKHTKLFLLTLTFFMFIIFNIFIFLDLGNYPNTSYDDSILSHPDDNPNNFDLHANAPLISTIIIRPNATLINNGFIPSGSVHEEIDDNVIYNNAGGDTDYIRGEATPDYCEVRMGPNLLSSNQKVIAMKIYARGRQPGVPGSHNIYTSFRWNIGGGVQSNSESVKFEDSSFSWLITNSWNNLELTQEDMNDLRVRISILNSDTDKFQDISVMYAELTVRTNRVPDVNIISPIGGEDLQDGTSIDWSYSDLDEETVFFNISYDLGDNNWQLIVSGLINETSYLWNFSGITETNHAVRVNVTGYDENGGKDDSISGIFTVRVNRDPEINLISPIGGEVLQDEVMIEWSYFDPDEETVFFNISYDFEDDNWQLVVSGLVNATSYSWDLSTFTLTQNVRINVSVIDGYGGFNSSISGSFTIRVNREPTINLITPNGGEILQGSTLIQWEYTELDGDTLTFNISYDLGDNNWQLIVSGLINETSYSWDLSNFTQTQTNVRIKIEVSDGYGAYVVNISDAYFTIKINNQVDNFDFLVKVIGIGSVVGITGVLFVGVFYKQKKKKKKEDKLDKISKKSDPYSSGVQSIITNENGNKKIIIEADILIKKGEKYSERDLLSNFLSKGNLSNKIENNDDYEVIRVLGKINITTLSEDFWEKIDHFEWENDDKEEFINDMLALPPNCREQFLNEMLDRFNGD